MFISDSDVDTVDDCLDGHFLVVCQRNGNLHLIYVPQKSTLLTIVRDGADLICPMNISAIKCVSVIRVPKVLAC